MGATEVAVDTSNPRRCHDLGRLKQSCVDVLLIDNNNAVHKAPRDENGNHLFRLRLSRIHEPIEYDNSLSIFETRFDGEGRASWRVKRDGKWSEPQLIQINQEPVHQESEPNQRQEEAVEPGPFIMTSRIRE